VDDKQPGGALPRARRADLPVRRVTVNAIIAWNMAFYRKAAGLTQEELGELLGWGKTIVSTAERSWDAKRVRNFSAEDLTKIAVALEIPIAGLFLPPEDDGITARYVLQWRGREDMDLSDLLAYVYPSYEGDFPVMDAYRKRLIAARAPERGEPEPVMFDETRPFEDNMDTAARVLSLAQQTADQAIADARGEADKTLGRARTEVGALLMLAKRQAEQITADARSRAESLELDAQERHRQAMGSLVEHREQLEQRIDGLRVFERDYRSRLQALLEGQMRELWAGAQGSGIDKAMDELQARAVESSGQRVSAVVLREDGTYDVLQLGPAREGGPGAAEDRSDPTAEREGGTGS
jgi:transcriptional regulator with XRE-family HTH domain